MTAPFASDTHARRCAARAGPRIALHLSESCFRQDCGPRSRRKCAKPVGKPTDSPTHSPGTATRCLWPGAWTYYPQARLNQVLANIYGCDVTNASHVNYAGTDASSSATHKLVVRSPILGALTLTGNLTYTFIGAGSGDYSVKMQGALQDAAAGVQLDVYVNDQKGGTTQTVELIVNLKNLG